jgi:purine-binding chemotaxis protein CheW
MRQDLHTERARADDDLYLLFMVGGSRCALSLAGVERIEAAVAPSLLPQAPAIVRGVVNWHGELIPLLELRQRFGLAARAIELSDRMVITNTATRRLALLVDSVAGVECCPAADIVAPGEVVPGLEHLRGIARLPDGVLVIHDVEALLAAPEEQALAAALSEGGSHAAKHF